MEKFERHVADDKRIDLVGEGDMSLFLSTRYYFDFQTGQIPADQDCYLDDLAANHGLTNSNSCELSMEPSVGLIPLPAQTNQSRVSVFSMIFWDIMFLATNSMPSIAFAISALVQT